MGELVEPGMANVDALAAIVARWRSTTGGRLEVLAKASDRQVKTIERWLREPVRGIDAEILTHACAWAEAMGIDDQLERIELICAWYEAHGGQRALGDVLALYHLAAQAAAASSDQVDQLRALAHRHAAEADELVARLSARAPTIW